MYYVKTSVCSERSAECSGILERERFSYTAPAFFGARSGAHSRQNRSGTKTGENTHIEKADLSTESINILGILALVSIFWINLGSLEYLRPLMSTKTWM